MKMLLLLISLAVVSASPFGSVLNPRHRLIPDPDKVADVQCPDGRFCPDGNTCCPIQSGGYGCCPLQDAVCCSDQIHCCPHATTCDVEHGQCVQENPIKWFTRNEAFHKSKAIIPLSSSHKKK